MPICSQCKLEYMHGKKICGYCGQELYKGLLLDLQDDEEQHKQVSWSRLTSATSDTVADEIIKRLAAVNVPAIKKSDGVLIEEFSVYESNYIDILVPEGMENKAEEALN